MNDYPYCCEEGLMHLTWDDERRNKLFGNIKIKYCPFCGHLIQAPVDLETFDFEDCVRLVLDRCKRFNNKDVHGHVSNYLRIHNYESLNSVISEICLIITESVDIWMITHVNVGIENFDFEDCYHFVSKNVDKSYDINTAVLHYICEKFGEGVNIRLSKKDRVRVCKILRDLGL